VSLNAALNAISESERAFFPHSLPAECFREQGLFTASEMEPHQPPACAQLFQEIASWLSLATRSKASVELLMRY
jgi:hypothetical protein